MRKIALISIALLIGASAWAERVRIKIRQDYIPGQKIFLKQELNRHFRRNGMRGLKARDFKLNSVKVIVEGRGPMALSMAGRHVDRQGILRDGIERRRGVYAVHLQARHRPHLQNGHWQIHFVGGRRAHYFVKRIVMDIQPKRFRRHRRHDRRDRWERFGKRVGKRILRDLLD